MAPWIGHAAVKSVCNSVGLGVPTMGEMGLAAIVGRIAGSIIGAGVLSVGLMTVLTIFVSVAELRIVLGR
jgi:hypothetical protein